MKPTLQQETERLTRSWMRHDAPTLMQYLVSGVEDARINPQSILSRHFLVQALAGERFDGLMRHEYRFAAAMNWLCEWLRGAGDLEEVRAVLDALQRGADNTESTAIPRFVLRTFAALAAQEGGDVPNYIAGFLAGAHRENDALIPPPEVFETFQHLWSHTLVPGQFQRISVLEPACGSANDYRFLQAFGIAQWLDYTGMELCATNVENARALFPNVRFEQGNVFEIAASAQQYDYTFFHDLLEHLSLEGLETAISELCRVTRVAVCAGFFQMDETPAHLVRPVDEYYWNMLSLSEIRRRFAEHGFVGRVFHIGSFQREHTGSERYHNPNAYTLMLWRSP